MKKITNRFILSSSIFMMAPGYSFPGYGKEEAHNARSKAPPATSPAIPAAVRDLSSSIDQTIPRLIIEGPSATPVVDLAPLLKNESPDNPLGSAFDYRKAFAKLDFEQVKADMTAVLRDSKEFWPADYGHYGPLFIRLSWHSAGTFRAIDGRGGADGGQMRFYPLAQWPDNANLDKARLLIQPVVDKYYPNLSWADAMVLAGDIAMRDMGFKTLGFAGGRVDDTAPDMVYWGPEDEFLKSERFDEKGNLQLPLAASVMGLIYVNPEGPDGKPDPALSAERIRITFGRMGMNDEETVALIAGGHTFGKMHGKPAPEECKDSKGNCLQAKGANANTSGIEGSWTSKPVQWTHEYLSNLYKYNWKVAKGPGGKFQWFPENIDEADLAPDAHNPSEKVTITMTTADIALKTDAKYKEITTRYLNNPQEFGDAFAKAWFKLIHRDLGPKSRYLGNDFSKEDYSFQDPVPAANYEMINAADIRALKDMIKKCDLSISDWVKTAWASSATFRKTDMRGGSNGARVALMPQKSWEVNEPQLLEKSLKQLETIKSQFNAARKTRQVSLADLIVLAGNTAVEQAAKAAGYEINIPFTPGRSDASQEQTDIASFNVIKVTSDGFRNYHNASESYLTAEKAFVERADMLNLTRKEMVALTGGLRVLGANHNNVPFGELTQNRGTLSNDYFINLLDNNTKWVESSEQKGIFDGVDRKTGKQKWKVTSQDLMFGTSGELRMLAFTYADQNAKRKFVADFADAWGKVMSLGRFDLKSH